MRASVSRASSVAFDEIATALPAPVVSVSLRTWPFDFPNDIAVQRRAPHEARADAIMYRQELAELRAARLARLLPNGSWSTGAALEGIATRTRR